MDAPRTGESACVLHNMSAPPRSVSRVRPLRSDGSADTVAGAGGDAGRAFAGGPSSRFFARVHLVGLLSRGDSHACVGVDLGRRVPGLPCDLIDAVALLRTGRKTGKARAAAAEACERIPVPELIDEFVGRVAALGDRGLPPLLFARPLDSASPAPPRIDPLTALRLLAGTAGGVFVRARAPSAAHFLAGLPGAEGASRAEFDYHLAIAHG